MKTQKAARGDSVLSLLYLKADVYERRTALSIKEQGRWSSLSYRQVQQMAKDVSSYLIEWGLQPGDRVAILSESRPEWGVTVFATTRTGAMLVPLDTKLSKSELASILADCRPRILFASKRYWETAEALRDSTLSIEQLFLLNDGDTVHGAMQLMKMRPSGSPEGKDRRLEECALIVYTSGTTGQPKGVMITFGNLLFQVKRLQEIIGLGARDVFLSLLPMHHLLELTSGFLGALNNGGEVCYCDSLYPKDVAQAMQEKRVTIMFTVPMFLKLLKSNLEREAEKCAPAWFKVGMKISGLLPARPLRRLLFHHIHRQLGGRLRGFVCGGASLEAEVEDFFDLLGIPIYQGYGLTETSPIIATNTPRHNRKRSVGRALPGVELRILKNPDEAEGEVLTRGPHVMAGYYRRNDVTSEVIDKEGWLHTGDLGRLDKDGYLYITGRKKNLIVLGAGKKVHPEELEDILSKATTAKEICIAGRLVKEGLQTGTEEVCAVVVPSDEIVQKYSQNIPEIADEIMKELDTLLVDVAPYKRPTRTFIHMESLPKTGSAKVKRAYISQWVEKQGVFTA